MLGERQLTLPSTHSMSKLQIDFTFKHYGEGTRAVIITVIFT